MNCKKPGIKSVDPLPVLVTLIDYPNKSIKLLSYVHFTKWVLGRVCREVMYSDNNSYNYMSYQGVQ